LEINGNRSARTAIALAAFRIAQAEARTTLLAFTYEVRLAVLSVEQARSLLHLTETQVSDAQTLEWLAKKQIELGTRPGIDLETLTLETLRTENLRIQAASAVRSAETTLNLLLGRPAAAMVPALAPLSLPQEALFMEALLASALSLRPELKQADAEREGTYAQQKLLQAEGKPDVSPMIRIGSLFRRTPAGSTGNGAGVGVAISLPLDYGSRRAQKAGQQERLEAIKSHREDLSRQIESEVREAAEKLKTAQAILVRYESQALPHTERLLRASRIGFEEGKTSVLAVIETQRTHRLIQSETLKARHDVLFAAAALDKVRGLSLISLPDVQP
jgi:cobalt-zinc-cadmium efflux system outer membrane protein